MTLYLYRCPIHGEQEVRKPMAQAGEREYCRACTQGDGDYSPLPMQRIYTSPVTDCHSYGLDYFPGRTPFHRRRPRNAAQEEAIWDAKQESRYVRGGEGARFEVHP